MVLAALCVSCIGLQPVQAQEQPKGFGDTVAAVRLGGEPRLEHGAYRAAVIVTMPSGSHTYWKEPGDAGVPPIFVFTGSSNVAKAEVLFPVPARLREDGLEAFGYVDRVAFPILVTPANPGKPTTLHLDMSYAVCDRICMPGHATGDLVLPIGSAADASAVAAAFAAVPTSLSPAEVSQLAVTPIAGAPQPSWTLAWHGERAVTDVFADAPEGFAFDTHPGPPGTWTLVASQSAADAKSTHVPVSLTLASPQGGLTTATTLELPAAKP